MGPASSWSVTTWTVQPLMVTPARRASVCGTGRHAAGEGGQQGRVDVEDAVGVGGDDEGSEDGVEAGQGDEVGAGFLK